MCQSHEREDDMSTLYTYPHKTGKRTKTTNRTRRAYYLNDHRNRFNYSDRWLYAGRSVYNHKNVIVLKYA